MADKPSDNLDAGRLEMSILITGGAGYVGLHTAVSLITAGRDVVLVDNFINCERGVVENAEKITGKKIKCYDADVADKAAMERIFAENTIEAVIHCAGLKAVGESCEMPLRYYRINLDTTLTLLETMEKFGVKRLVFSSSATVYGLCEKMPLTEDMPTGCTNPYGWTKFMIEQILKDAAAADEKLSVVLLRYFNPVGAHESGLIGETPKGTPNNIMPYIALVAAGKLPKVNVFGGDWPTKDGTGMRDYLHVSDLADGHIAAVDFTAEHTGCEIINLGTGRAYSVLELIETFSKVSGQAVPYEIVGRRAGDIAECCADASKAERLLGWKAERGLEKMSADTWRWQKNSGGAKL